MQPLLLSMIRTTIWTTPLLPSWTVKLRVIGRFLVKRRDPSSLSHRLAKKEMKLWKLATELGPDVEGTVIATGLAVVVPDHPGFGVVGEAEVGTIKKMSKTKARTRILALVLVVEDLAVAHACPTGREEKDLEHEAVVLLVGAAEAIVVALVHQLEAPITIGKKEPSTRL